MSGPDPSATGGALRRPRTGRLAVLVLLALLPACALPFGSSKLPDAPQPATEPAQPVPTVPNHPNDLTFPDRALALPRPERFVLANGLVVLLFPDERQPRVTLRAHVDAGARHDPDEHEGLAFLTAHALLGEASGPAPAGRVEERGGSALAEADADTARFTFDLPAADAELGVEWLAELLLRPRFEDAQVAAQCGLVGEEAAREAEDSARFVRGRFEALILAGQQAGRLLRGTSDSRARLTAADCAAFHRERYRPHATRIGVAGGFRADALRAALERRFGAWEGGRPAAPAAEAAPRSERAVALLDRNVDFCHLVVGHPTVPATHPDGLALQVLNQILGADPVTSRLPRLLETDCPSARETRSRFTRAARSGTFRVETSCVPDDAPALLTLVLGELRRLQREPVSERELATSIETLRNSFAFRFDSTGEIIDEYLTAEALGLPADHLATWRERVARVTAEDVRRVAQEHLHPDAATVLAVGPAERLRPALAPFGLVQIVDAELRERATD